MLLKKIYSMKEIGKLSSQKENVSKKDLNENCLNFFSASTVLMIVVINLMKFNQMTRKSTSLLKNWETNIQTSIFD